jgi:hypothetical protein
MCCESKMVLHRPFIEIDRPTFSGTHRDKTSSILHCVCGTKTVFLCPPNVPKQMPDLYAQHPGNEDWLIYDPFSDPQTPPHWQRCDLIPGESVFIPAGWWHNVLSPVDTIGLSVDITSTNVGENSKVAAEAAVDSGHPDPDEDDDNGVVEGGL